MRLLIVGKDSDGTLYRPDSRPSRTYDHLFTFPFEKVDGFTAHHIWQDLLPHDLFT